MKLRKRNAFTLIELVGVLVIMAIIALIATPLVMNIIRKARISADKRSIDAYGRSIELAIAGYLLDIGKFPTEVSQLTIEYSGNQVVCETTKINSDSSVYLAGCTVNGRGVEGYTYGKEEVVTYKSYQVGDEVSYNNVNYYVIKDSGVSEDSVTLLKAEPLTVAEVNEYGVGHENRYINYTVGTVYNMGCYGVIAYYTSETCGYVNNNNVYLGCTTDYAHSEVKYVVDAWKSAKAPLASEARLISKDEYEPMITVETYETPTAPGTRYVPQYDWQYNYNYWYWTYTPYTDSSSYMWRVSNDAGVLNSAGVDSFGGTVRPVIVLPKSAL